MFGSGAGTKGAGGPGILQTFGRVAAATLLLPSVTGVFGGLLQTAIFCALVRKAAAARLLYSATGSRSRPGATAGLRVGRAVPCRPHHAAGARGRGAVVVSMAGLDRSLSAGVARRAGDRRALAVEHAA